MAVTEGTQVMANKDAKEGREAKDAKDAKEDADETDDLHPEDGLLIPRRLAYVKDFMHHVTNVMYAFLSIINRSKKLSLEEAFIDGVTKRARGCKDEKTASSIFVVEKSIVELGKKRLAELCTSDDDWLNELLLEPRYYKQTRCHDCMIFVFSFFAYVFQDSMDDPVVYAMKIIVDCLSYMFNFNGDIRLLQYTQQLLNFYSGMLEGQVAPSLISYSLHANEHLAESILCYGPPVDINAINQERQYKTAKKNAIGSRDVNKTIQMRLMAAGICSANDLNAVMKVEQLYSASRCSSPERTEYLRSKLDSGFFARMTKLNIFYDARIYSHSEIPTADVVDKIIRVYRRRKDPEQILSQFTEEKVNLRLNGMALSLSSSSSDDNSSEVSLLSRVKR